MLLLVMPARTQQTGFQMMSRGAVQDKTPTFAEAADYATSDCHVLHTLREEDNQHGERGMRQSRAAKKTTVTASLFNYTRNPRTCAAPHYTVTLVSMCKFKIVR
jgi:hypothetical protein